jgi:LPXTG-motif cell wall-anchored protein
MIMRAIATAALVSTALLTPLSAAAAGRPGYQNVPNSGGETGFPGGSLPLTGQNVLGIVALGCFLLVCGLLLARASRRRS